MKRDLPGEEITKNIEDNYAKLWVDKAKESDLLQLRLNFFRNDFPKFLSILKEINKSLKSIDTSSKMRW